MTTRTAFAAALLGAAGLASCGGSEPAVPSDCIVALNVKPGILPGMDGVRLFLGDEPPKELPGCERVLAVGFRGGALAAEEWACNSRIPDALVMVDLPKHSLRCEQARPIPVLRYQRYPSHGQKEEALVDGIGPWMKRNRVDEHFTKIEDGDLLCRSYQGDARLTSCLLPNSKDWPVGVESNSELADTTALWSWATREWAR